MASAPRSERTGSSLRNSDENTWTLITSRSKTFKATENCSQPKESTAFQPSDGEVPATNRWTSRGQPPFKSFSWHQGHASSNRERHGLIGHPDVLYKDYRKKRKRGLLMTDDDETSSSESDLDSLDTESDSALDSEYGDDQETEAFQGSATTEETDQMHNQQYLFLRRALVEFIYTLFVIWMASARYIIPPEHRLKRPKKRTTKRTRMLIEETDPNDPNTVLVSPFDGYYHLACPFYIFDTNRHKNCVMKNSLRSIEDLVDHLENHHAEPPLCRICGKVFGTFKDRNDHLRNETCEPPSPPQNAEGGGKIPHGVSQLQRVKILKRDNPRRTEQDRWGRIYKTLFQVLDETPPPSPYLMDGQGLQFSLLHDYWKMKGKQCVREYLADHGNYGNGNDDGAEGNVGYGGIEFARLCSLVLEDLRRKVLLDEAGQHTEGSN